MIIHGKPPRLQCTSNCGLNRYSEFEFGFRIYIRIADAQEDNVGARRNSIPAATARIPIPRHAPMPAPPPVMRANANRSRTSSFPGDPMPPGATWASFAVDKYAFCKATSQIELHGERVTGRTALGIFPHSSGYLGPTTIDPPFVRGEKASPFQNGAHKESGILLSPNELPTEVFRYPSHPPSSREHAVSEQRLPIHPGLSVLHSSPGRIRGNT